MNLRSILLLSATLLVASANAAENGKRVKYVAPTGFAGHEWGEPRRNFDRLPEAPVGVGAAWMQALQKPLDLSAIPSTEVLGNGGGLDMTRAPRNLFTADETLLRLRSNFEGGGVYVLSEYSIDDQGFRFGDDADGVVLHPVIYEFCANWQGSRKKAGKEAPKNFDDLNQFCGMRFEFQSETREQLRKLPNDYVTAYDRVLEKLLAKYGRPKGYLRRGQVIIETPEGESIDPSDRRFSIWRWCPAVDIGFHTDCKASVTLSLNPSTGKGTVLYAAPLLWEFAWARENNGFKGDPLFRLLHARQ
jgi:hypothetical protein